MGGYSEFPFAGRGLTEASRQAGGMEHGWRVAVSLWPRTAGTRSLLTAGTSSGVKVLLIAAPTTTTGVRD
ncbi:hypothetical protein GCM10010363_60220 [Streptomyces omiyaensis]|nr:hypothetical protein GCM10010363_60220 [Streptomyces omiyaensis]